MTSHTKHIHIGKALLSSGAALLALGLAARPAQAGSGTYAGGQFSFCVAVRFNATPAQLNQIRTAFQNASQILADATDNQHRFGTVRILNNATTSDALDIAEYWVNTGTGRAYATLGKYGVRGEHINTYFQSDYQQIHSGPNGDAYTLAHEFSHHAYGVADEYSGPLGAAECAPTPDTATLNYCLMDNYFTRGGNAFGMGYTLNEYCVHSSHDPDHNTYQDSINGKSCWETIASHPTHPAVAPMLLPAGPAPALHVVNIPDGLVGVRAMLVIDKSGSMAYNNRMTYAKLSAGLFVDLLPFGTQMGLAAFDTTPSLIQPLTAINTAADRATLNAAINVLAPGTSTNIGGGLLTGLGEITRQPTRTCTENIVLLSDGDHNTGTDPLTVIPQIQNAGVTVFCVGVGNNISITGDAKLQTIANSTGGRYQRTYDPPTLMALQAAIALEITGSGILAQSPVPAGGQTPPQVLIEPNTKQATFVMVHPTPGASFYFALRSPSGVVYSSRTPGIRYFTNSTYAGFEIPTPEAGVWQAILDTNEKNLTWTVGAQSPGSRVTVSFSKESYKAGEDVIVKATPQFSGQNLVGASVSGIVTRPDGTQAAVTLRDDGAAATSGDDIKNDGVYSARFTATIGGQYDFTMNVSSSFFASVFPGETLFKNTPANGDLPPDLVRSGHSSVRVIGPTPGTVQGIINLEGIAPFAAPQDITFDFRTDNGVAFSLVNSIAPDGSYVFTGLTPGIYDVAIKGAKWLRTVIHKVDFRTGAATVNATLRAGDANDSNTVDLRDFALLVNAFGGNTDLRADFNCDGSVDLTDFGLIVNEFGSFGDN